MHSLKTTNKQTIFMTLTERKEIENEIINVIDSSIKTVFDNHKQETMEAFCVALYSKEIDSEPKFKVLYSDIINILRPMWLSYTEGEGYTIAMEYYQRKGISIEENKYALMKVIVSDYMKQFAVNEAN